MTGKNNEKSSDAVKSSAANATEKHVDDCMTPEADAVWDVAIDLEAVLDSVAGHRYGPSRRMN